MANGRRGVPQPKKRPQPKPAPKKLSGQPGNRPNRRVPGSGDLYNPFNSRIVPTLQSEGKAFPVEGMAIRGSDVVSDRTLIVVTNTGESGTILGAYKHTGATMSVGVETVPTLADGSNNGGPTSMRAMKCGVQIINRTKLLDQGGKVTVLNASQRLALPTNPSGLSATQFTELCNDICNHPKAVPYNGQDFAHAKTFVCHPLDTTDYHRYDLSAGTDTADGFAAHWATWSGSTHYSRPMSTILIVLETIDPANKYDIRAKAAFYTRWPLDTIMGQNMKPIPTHSAAAVNKAKDEAEALAHVAREGAAGGVAAAAAGLAYKGLSAMRMGAARAMPALEMGAEAAPMLLPLLG